MTAYRGEDRRKEDAGIAALRRDMHTLLKKMDANTKLCEATAGTVAQVKHLAETTAAKVETNAANNAPVLAAWSTVQRGVKVMDTLGRFGDWLLSKWKPILIIGVAVKVVMTGGSLTEAWKTLVRIFKAGE